MKDQLHKISCPALELRAYTVSNTSLVNELCSLHNTTPNGTYAFAQSITAASLLSSQLKPESKQSLAFKINGSGPLKLIYVQANSNGGIRGYVGNPQPDYELKLEHIDFSKSIGAGTITVIKELGMKEPYSGISPLVYGSVAQDTAYYLSTSEQTPSALIIACETAPDGTITASGGILIQTWPETPQDAIAKVEEKINTSPSLGEHLKEGKDILDYLSMLFSHETLELLETIELKHSCSCSREVISNSLRTVAVNDLTAMIEEDHGAEIKCTFCNEVYTFTEEDLKSIVELKKQ